MAYEKQEHARVCEFGQCHIIGFMWGLLSVSAIKLHCSEWANLILASR